MTNATVVFWQDICIVKDNEEVKVNLSHQTTQQELCRRHLSFQILLWRLPLSKKRVMVVVPNNVKYFLQKL